MNAAKNGYIAEFVTGYLQREIRMEVKVANGTDTGLRDPLVKGIAVGRLAKIDGGYLVPAATLTEAQYIVAQSDDTIRDLPEDYNYTERYNYVPNLIVKNSEEIKTVALYKIVNKDDIKLVKIAEPVNVLGAHNASGTFTLGGATFQFIPTGINSYKVIGTAPYIASPIVSGNPAGNYLYFKLVNSEITTAAAYNAATTGIEGTDIVYKRISGLSYNNTETKNTIASEINTNGGIEVEVCINDTNTITIEMTWRTGETSTYTFDLTDLQREANV